MLSVQIGSLIMTAEPAWGTSATRLPHSSPVTPEHRTPCVDSTDDRLDDELRFGGNPTVADIPVAPIQVPVNQRSLCHWRMSGIRPT